MFAKRNERCLSGTAVPNARSPPVPPGSGRGRRPSKSSTCCSSMRPRRCRSPMCSRSRRRRRQLVLLGDPRQLDQPTQGQPPGRDSVSALDYILDGRADHQPRLRDSSSGETWRLHPDICAFTSELFYEGRLNPVAGLERQEIRSRRASPAVPGSDTSRRAASGQSELVARGGGGDSSNRRRYPGFLERPGSLGKAKRSRACSMTSSSSRPTTPRCSSCRIGSPGARIGTVDKFQGQEAPIVIYSMTTSTHADAPRGMNFLYSLNRLNVATSRARVLEHPRLLAGAF